MKKIKILAMLIATYMFSMTFTSCDQKDKLDSDLNGNASNAYLPIEYADKQVEAWYMYTDQGSDKTKIEAVFLFEDSTLVVTKVKIYSKADGRGPEYGISATGRFVITQGDFSNGKADVVTGEGEKFEVKIENGKLYAMDQVFTKMSNSLIPSAYNPNNGGNGGNNGGNNNGGNNGGNSTNDTEIAFYPMEYANSKVVAWYTNVSQDNQTTTTQALYLFEDGAYCVSAFVEIGGGYEQIKAVVDQGTYSITDGNLTNGSASVKSKHQNEPINVVIKNGNITAANTTYTKQDNSKLPTPSDPSDNQYIQRL